MNGSPKPASWLPLLGEWDLSDTAVLRFTGGSYDPLPAAEENVGEATPPPPQKSPAHGIALSSASSSGGAIEATFTFDNVERAVGEIIVAYNPATRGMITAGVSGAADMFSVREWLPPPPDNGEGDQSQRHARWDVMAASGTGSNLQAGRAYHVRTFLRGSKIDLIVNEVHVVSTWLRRSIRQPSSRGVFCSSFEAVTIADFMASSEPPRAFVAMQLSDGSADIYFSVIKSVCGEFDVSAIRADEIYGPGVIIGDIVEQVVTAQVMIADISTPNPNVYFEIGYALAMRKPIVLLAKKNTALPFDVSGFRVLFYEDSIAGKAKVESGLRKHLATLLGPR